MDAEFLRWALMGLMSLVMYFGKHTIDDLKAAQTALELELQIVKDTRLHKDDFKEFKQELRGQFDEIKQAIRDLKPHVG
jgi:hypothetical protein